MLVFLTGSFAKHPITVIYFTSGRISMQLLQHQSESP